MKNQILFESNEIQAYMLASSHSEIRLKCGLIRARKVLFLSAESSYPEQSVRTF